MKLDLDSTTNSSNPSLISEILHRHRNHWMQSYPRLATIASFILFFASIAVTYFAEIYATERASNSVTDIILSNVPVFDVDGLFVYGSIALIVFATIVLMLNPKRLPFTLHTFTLFYFTRAAFISLTHIGLFPVHIANDFGTAISTMFFGGGLFFSGHTGAPFLLALLFWKERTLRYIFITWSVLMGMSALLGHLHYTIDVVSAFFITYSVFRVSEIVFKKDRELFHSETQTVFS